MTPEPVLQVQLKHTVPGDRGFSLDVSFEVRPGITILFGPSGSGKSTTLSAIAGLLRPDAGRITLGSEVWFDAKTGEERAVERRGVSFVFQSLALFPHLSALSNVMFGIDQKLPKQERRRRALQMLERMKVPHLAEQRPPTFSGGEAQRVALARAFARDPKLVLLDEAFSAMDRELRRELCEDVRVMINELRIPAIMVTHHRVEAMAMGNQVVLIAKGQVRASGSAAEMLAL